VRERARATLTVFVVALALCLLPPSAGAQSPDEQARIHFEAGEQYYVRGQYDLAIREFEEAYRIAPAPALLYNISQAYERNGQFQPARDYLAKYIDSGAADPAELPVLEDKLTALDEKIEAEKNEPPPPPHRPLKVTKWIVGGAGLALTVAGVYFALDASAMQGDLEDAATLAPKVTYGEDLDAKYTRGERSALLGKIFGIAGGALVVTGAVFFYLDLRAAQGAPERAPSPEPAVTAAPMIGPGLAGGMVRWRF
jgi:tetratricopeptide (TPR) repeat protein